MAEPRLLRQREVDLATRAAREQREKDARERAARKRGQGTIKTDRTTDTATGALYEGFGLGVQGINRLFGASERDAVQRGRRVTESVRGLLEAVIGPEEMERAVAKTATGRGDANDIIVAGLSVAPLPKVVRNAVGKGVRKLVDSRAGRYLREVPGEALTPKRPKYDVGADGGHLTVARKDLKRETIPAITQAKSIDEMRAHIRKPDNPALRIASEEGLRTRGKGLSPDDPMPKTSLARQGAMGRAYQEAASGNPAYKHAIFERYGELMPEVVEQAGAQNYDQLTEASYRALGDDVQRQFDQMPISMRYHYGDGEYPVPSAMFRDALGNGNLNVFRGGEPHEFLNELDPATGLSLNEEFRAVHDYLGHASTGSTFRPDGEEIAYATHARSVSPLAQLALAAETRGQNSLVNYSPLNAGLTGEMNTIRKQLQERGIAERLRSQGKWTSDAERVLAELPPTSDLNARLRELGARTEFAPQKAVLLPPEFLDPMSPGGMPDYLRRILDPQSTTSARGVHISKTDGLAATDPSFYGSGHQGQEYGRVAAAGGPDRTYFYSGPEGTVNPETSVMGSVNGELRRGPRYAYEAGLDGLYDIDADPERLVELAKAYNLPDYEPMLPYNALYAADAKNFGGSDAAGDMERLIRDYGYSGYITDRSGPEQRWVALYDPVEELRRIERGINGYARGGLVETR